MRPLQLVLEGFESYCNKTEIDFEKLGEKGIYLISGDTGAGKTTIFDAITYALYGSSSGEDRETSMLRSTQADETKETYVKLTFTVGGQKYRVTRNPEYERKSKRGEGVTKENANALLEYFDGRPPVESIKKVDIAVQAILKLNCSDFRQIAMIAQGKFEKFLLAQTSEKIGIFRNIFKTDCYNQLQERLNKNSSELQNEYETISKSIKNDLASITFDEDDVLNQKLLQIQNSELLDENSLEILNKIIKKDERKLKEFTDELAEKRKKENILSEQLGKVSEKKEIQSKLNENEIKFSEDNKLCTELKIKCDNEKLRESEKKELEKEKTLLENMLPEYERISAEEKRIETEKKEIKVGKCKIEQVEKDLENLKKTLAEGKEELSGLLDAGEMKEKYKNQHQKFDGEKHELEKYLGKAENLIQNLIKQQKEEKELEELIHEWEFENKDLMEQKTRFYRAQAGILAEKLKENQPCPVCGSLNHPAPAEKEIDSLSEKELQQKEADVAETDKKVQEKSSNLKVLKQEIKSLVDSIKEGIGKYIDEINLENELAVEETNKRISVRIGQLKGILTELEENIKNENRKISRREELNLAIPQKEELLKKNANELQNIQTETEKKEAAVKESEKNLSVAKSKLKFQNEKEAHNQLTDLVEKIQKIQKSIETAEKKYEDCNKEIISLSGIISEQKEMLNKFDSYDEEQIQKDFIEIEIAVGEVTKKRDIINSRIAKNRQYVKQININAKEMLAVSEKYKMVRQLAVTASGQISGKAKVMLETYIQMNYLDRILMRANQRFCTMTDGIYELVRVEDASGLRSQFGLELNVRDYHSGTLRPVQSLSGGEKFQASLSLALGLADEIQESSSGICIESMFIDEGFATLDTERLSKVMKSLNDISNNNKLIGLISHVGDLYTDIMKHINVTKDSKGISKAEITLD